MVTETKIILNAVNDISDLYPDMRFGQILSNLDIVDRERDIFYDLDPIIICRIADNITNFSDEVLALDSVQNLIRYRNKNCGDK